MFFFLFFFLTTLFRSLFFLLLTTLTATLLSLPSHSSPPQSRRSSPRFNCAAFAHNTTRVAIISATTQHPPRPSSPWLFWRPTFHMHPLVINETHKSVMPQCCVLVHLCSWVSRLLAATKCLFLFLLCCGSCHCTRSCCCCYLLLLHRFGWCLAQSCFPIQLYPTWIGHPIFLFSPANSFVLHPLAVHTCPWVLFFHCSTTAQPSHPATPFGPNRSSLSHSFPP